jgi:hypothetical protein
VPSQNLRNDTNEGSEIEMNNQIILMGLGMISLLLVGLPKAFSVDQPSSSGCDSNGSCGKSVTSDKSTDSKPTDTGPTITQKEIDHPKTIHIPGQSKCQTLDGFSGPCGNSSHHSGHKHSKHTSSSSIVGTPINQGSELTQLPSNRSDFSNGDDINSIRLAFVNGNVDHTGFWHVKGMVQNTGNKTIQMLTIIGTIYNAALQPISSMQQPAIIGNDTTLRPGQEKPFELYDSIVGQKAVFFKLGYDW